MRLVDANVLLYAVNSDAVHHERSRAWLDDALSGSTTVGLAWVALLAFMRLSTRADLFPSPLSVDEATDIVATWLAAPTAVVLHPTVDHLTVVARMLGGTGAGGNLVNDAHLAALAIEHGAIVTTFDTDFGRFDGVQWERP